MYALCLPAIKIKLLSLSLGFSDVYLLSCYLWIGFGQSHDNESRSEGVSFTKNSETMFKKLSFSIFYLCHSIKGDPYATNKPPSITRVILCIQCNNQYLEC